MYRLIVLLLLLVVKPVHAMQDMCSVSIQDKAPMAEIAPEVLQVDIDTGRNANDPLKAIQHFQKHNFYMKHPDLSAPSSLSRCAPPNMYRQLNDETAKIVNTLFQKYKSNHWFLSENEIKNPGLLRLLLLSNQYDTFLIEAEGFLLNAKDDAEAPHLFDRVHSLINRRLNTLLETQKNLNNVYYSHGFGLLDIETQGLEFLSQAPARIDALRQVHIDFLLGKEEKVFPKIKNNPPSENALVLFNPDAMESLIYLERAIKVSIKKQQAQIIARAEMRGDDLVSDNRHREAIPYFELAMAEEKLAKSEIIVELETNALAEKTKQEAEKEIKSVLKTEKESKKFERETDALAEELGIDLDNF